jgi:hypothetical protein
VRVNNDAYATCHVITASTATTITYASDTAHFSVNDVYVIRPMSFETPTETYTVTGSPTTSTVRVKPDPGWSTNQWVSYHFVSIEDGTRDTVEYGPVTSNTSDTLTFEEAGTAPYASANYVKALPQAPPANRRARVGPRHPPHGLRLEPGGERQARHHAQERDHLRGRPPGAVDHPHPEQAAAPLLRWVRRL